MEEENSYFVKKGDTLYLITSTEVVDYLNSVVGLGLISSLHRISSKGIFESLVECCKKNKLGFDITGDSDMEDDDFLYKDTKYVAIVSVNDEQENDFVNFLYAHDIAPFLLGHVTKGELRMDDHSFGFIDKF